MIALIIYVCISQQPYHFPPTCLYIYKYIHISINPTISLHFFRHRFIIFYQNKRKVLPAEQKGGGRFHGLATRIAARWAAQEYMYYLNKYYRVKKVEEWINFNHIQQTFHVAFLTVKHFLKIFSAFLALYSQRKGIKGLPHQIIQGKSRTIMIIVSRHRYKQRIVIHWNMQFVSHESKNVNNANIHHNLIVKEYLFVQKQF